MLLCVEYLNMRSIIYRDIKPENLMIDHTGYLKMIDLGTAKLLDKNIGYRTFTIIGKEKVWVGKIKSRRRKN